MSEHQLFIATWSSLKGISTGRLGYLGSLASGNLVGSGEQSALYVSGAQLPPVIAESSSYCWVSLKNDAAPISELHAPSALVMPVALDDVEAVYFTSESRRREFLADMRVSGFREDDLQFARLVWPGDLPTPQPRQAVGDLQSRVMLLDSEIAFQERVSAAIACAAAVVWWREKDLPALRRQESPEKYKRLVAWAMSAQGVVDSDGRWSRTSVEQSFPMLAAAGLGDQIRVYETYIHEKSWPVADGALLATALLMLARTEGGTPDSIVNQLLALNGMAIPSEYALSDVMIFIAVALGRHHLPHQWRPNQENLASMVHEEIHYASSRYQSLVPHQTPAAASPERRGEVDLPPVLGKPKKKSRKRDLEAAPVDIGDATGDSSSEPQLTWSNDELDAHLPPAVKKSPTPLPGESKPLQPHTPPTEEKI